MTEEELIRLDQEGVPLYAATRGGNPIRVTYQPWNGDQGQHWRAGSGVRFSWDRVHRVLYFEGTA